MTSSARVAMVACLLALGCDEPPSADGGVTPDAATARDGGVDAGPIEADAGPEADAGVDAGTDEDGGGVDGGLDAATIADGGTDGGGIDPSTIPAPRPITPSSGTLTTSFDIRFRWALTAPATGARVEVCRDLACTDVRLSFDADGESATRLIAPDPGATSRVLYFRLTGLADGVLGAHSSPVWSLSVHGRVGIPGHATWGSIHDFDGDGLSDVLGGAPASSTVRLYRGRSPVGGAPAADTTFAAAPAIGLGAAVFAAGDVNGDGFADLAIGTATDLLIYHGRLGGFGASMTLAAADTTIAGVSPSASTVAMAGDVDRDGYADVVIADPAMGRVLLHRGGPTGVSTTGTPLADTAPGFGASVAGGCDVNGDGFGDVIVGATDAAFVIFGAAAGLDASTLTSLPLGPSAAGFGASVACAGDVNGDGYPDVIVGAPGDDAAFVYHGSAAGAFAAPNGVLRKVPGPPPGVMPGQPGTRHLDAFGSVVAAAGDVNADGFCDVIVVAPDLYMDYEGFLGSAFVFHGSASGLPTTSVDSSTAHQRSLGASPAENRISVAQYAGDVNGDGFHDVVVGAPLRGSDSGSILLYVGEPGSLAPRGTEAWLISGGTLTEFGTTIAALPIRGTPSAG